MPSYPEVRTPKQAFNESLGQATQVAREAEIPRELSRVQQQLEIMERMFAKLSDRLAPVMTPDRPSDPQAEKAVEPTITAVGNGLRQFSNRISSYNDLIENLCRRLET